MDLEFQRDSIFYGKKVSSIVKQESFSNEVFAFSCEGKNYIYRHFNNCKHSQSQFEKELTVFLYKHNLTTEMIEFVDKSYMVTRKIEGRELSQQEFLKWEWISSLKKLHSQQYGKNIFRLEEEILKLYSDTPNKIKYQNAIESLKANPEFFSDLYHELSLCHLDLNPKNIFIVKKDFLFIDFEFTMMSSALVDLSQMLAHLEISKAQKENLFQIYGLSKEDSLKVESLEKYSCLFWALWCSSNRKSKDWESYYFDHYENSSL